MFLSAYYLQYFFACQTDVVIQLTDVLYFLNMENEVEDFSVESLKWERKKVSLSKDTILIFPDLCKQVPFKGKNFLFSKYGLNRLEMETSRK